jgi:predicted GNAT family N-acyltransferase
LELLILTMPEWRIIQPQTETHWQQVYDLRYTILREPWQQPKGSEKVDDDATSLHAAILNSQNDVIATARIHQLSQAEAQIRFMAVSRNWQGKGIGEAVLRFTEGLGRRNYKGITHYCLHAREGAVEFYKKNGYTIVEKSYVLFDSIQHYLMKKCV